jgi:hypothetical protein
MGWWVVLGLVSRGESVNLLLKRPNLLLLGGD